jgi:hypothetical protein
MYLIKRELVYMKRPIEPNLGQSVAPLQLFLINETLHHVDKTQK